MGLRINTNVASLSAQRNLNIATNRVSLNFEHLSTGRRIARASDDAAGLAISTRLTAQTRSLSQASRNASDGVSLVQTGEAGLDDIAQAIIRGRELAIQSSNGTLAGADKDALQNEFQQLIAQVNQVANSPSFNGLHLLNGTSSAITLHIGEGVTAGVDTLAITLTSALASALNISTLDIGSTGNATTAIQALDQALDQVSTLRSTFGAVQNTLTGTIASIENRIENLSAANSRIVDVDIAFETAELTKNNILQQAALSVLAQANQQPSSALALLRQG